jgi:hypothetical protein
LSTHCFIPSWNIRIFPIRIFGEHSGNIRGTFREHSGNIQGTFREHSGNIQGSLECHLRVFWRSSEGVVVKRVLQPCAEKAAVDFVQPPPGLGFSLLGGGHLESWSMVHGQWSTVNGPWSMVHGQWYMVNGPWSMVHGQWCMVNGSRSMVHGQWSMVHGQWYTVNGPR